MPPAVPNVTARVERKGVSRIYVGASAPSGLVGLPMERGEIVQFSNLGTTDKVFLYTVDGLNAAWVIRG